MPKKNNRKGIGLAPKEKHREAQAAFLGKSWFLGIGIDQYEEFPRLRNAVKDVVETKKITHRKIRCRKGGVPERPGTTRNELNVILDVKFDWRRQSSMYRHHLFFQT